MEKNKIDIAKKCDSWDSNLQPPAWRTQDRAIDFWAIEARWISLFKNVFNLRRQTYWLIDATDH